MESPYISAAVITERMMQKQLRRDSGFTIIELLVVLAVIGLIGTSVIAVLSTSRAKNRDTKRETDIETFQHALELYITNTRAYPTTDADGDCITGTDATSSVLIVAAVASSIPRDPLHDCGTAFHYTYIAPTPFTYTITYSLETDSIPGKSCGSPPCAQRATP